MPYPMTHSLRQERERSLKCYRDDDGEFVYAGDKVQFSYGIPPVGVTGKVIERDGTLIVLTPGHKPKECKLRSLRRYVGAWWKQVSPPNDDRKPAEIRGTLEKILDDKKEH